MAIFKLNEDVYYFNLFATTTDNIIGSRAYGMNRKQLDGLLKLYKVLCLINIPLLIFNVLYVGYWRLWLQEFIPFSSFNIMLLIPGITLFIAMLRSVTLKTKKVDLSQTSLDKKRSSYVYAFFALFSLDVVVTWLGVPLTFENSGLFLSAIFSLAAIFCVRRWLKCYSNV